MTPKIDQGTFINEMLLKQFDEEEIVNSIDTVCDVDDAVNYPVEFLNSPTKGTPITPQAAKTL